VKRGQAGQAILELRNVGLGPALDIEVHVNGARVRSFLGPDDQLGVNGATWLRDAIPASESLFASVLGPQDESQILDLRVEYSSMLDETRSLEESLRIAPKRGEAFFPE